jgi:hypothetical protein
MPMTSGEWIIQGYRWAPCFGPKSQRLLQREGYSGEKFALAVSEGALGAGLPIEVELVLVLAGQTQTDRKLTRWAVEARRERMGADGWRLLVQWYALTYSAWLMARNNARAELNLQAVQNEGRRL